MTDPFIHPNAICETGTVGTGTRIWAFAHLLPGARVGRDCNICDGVFIENDVTVGDRVTIKCGVQLWDGLAVEDDVYIGPNATFTNDLSPRSKMRPPTFLKTTIRRGASIGANATILPGIEIGSGAMVGAGAVVTQTVPPNAIVVGNPARITGYMETAPVPDGVMPQVPACVPSGGNLLPSATSAGVGRCTLHQLRFVDDSRGNMSVGEYERDIPFVPKCYSLIFNISMQQMSGERAYKSCDRFLICVRGSYRLLLDDGEQRREVTLDRPDFGVYVPAMIWSTQRTHSPDAMLLVFASENCDSEENIGNY